MKALNTWFRIPSQRGYTQRLSVSGTPRFVVRSSCPIPTGPDQSGYTVRRSEGYGTHQWNNLAQISHNLQMPLLILIPEGNDDLGSSLG